MRTYNRRTFLKCSAAATTALAADRLFSFPARAASEVSGRQAPDNPFMVGAGKLDVIAHRGGDGQWPGETMLAMRRATELGADMLEMDVYLTKDNHLVLMHDNFVGSTTDVPGIKRAFPINKFNLAELQELNAAYRWSPGDGKTRPYNLRFKDLTKELQRNLRVPTLDEVFSEFPRTRMNVEMKWFPGVPSPAAALSRLIKDRRMTGSVLVASFAHPFLEEFRGLSKDVATSASFRELKDYLTRDKRPNAVAVQLTPQVEVNIKGLRLFKKSLLDREFVQKAHGDTLAVHAWTIDTLSEMSRVRDFGVDGIITDYPGTLLELLGRTHPQKGPM